MDKTEKGIDNYKNFDNAIFWTIGTLFTGILPYLTMLVGWIADDFSNPIISYYTGIADSAAFMYSVSLCLLLLCVDFDRNIHKKTRSICGAISGFSVIISTLFYGIKTISNVEKNFKLMAIESVTEKIAFYNDNMNNMSNKFSLLTSMIILAITISFAIVGYQIIKKSEEKNNESGNQRTKKSRKKN